MVVLIKIVLNAFSIFIGQSYDYFFFSNFFSPFKKLMSFSIK